MVGAHVPPIPFRPAHKPSRFRESTPIAGKRQACGAQAMTVFWLVAALFLAGALLMLLPPLWRTPGADAAGPGVLGVNLAVHRDQWREAERDLAAGLLSPEQFRPTRDEIRQRLQAELSAPVAAVAAQALAPARRTALALALLLPLTSVLGYLALGEPQAVAPAVAAGDRHSLQAEQIQRMVAALAERLQAQPDDVEGWLMLGRSYTALGRYRDAAGALRRAQALRPRDVDLLADLADVLGMAQGKRLAGEPAQLVQQALDLDPRHVKALALAGSVAFEARDYDNARALWQRLLAVLPADSPIARSVQGSIADATQRAQAGGPPPPADGGRPSAPVSAATATAAAATTRSAAAGAEAITGQVQLSAELAARLAPGSTLYVFARAAQGPRMPVAILRQPMAAGSAPIAFRLDDSLAMSPAARLSGTPQVLVAARISASGNATPQPGDLVAEAVAAAPGQRDLVLRIDRVQP